MNTLTRPLLLCLAAAAMLLSACDTDTSEKDVTSLFTLTWNANESITHHSDGSITYDAIAWGGLVGRLIEGDQHIDCSGYGKIVFEFAEPTRVNTQVMVGDKIKAWGSPGITSLQCSLQGENASYIDQVALQAAEPTLIKVKRIYLSQESKDDVSTAIWQGTSVFGNWATGLYIDAGKFYQAEAGDRLEIVYATDDASYADYWQMKMVVGTTGEVLEGNAADLDEGGCVNLSRGSGRYSFALTAHDLELLRQNGLFIGGYYVTVSQCNLLEK